MSTQSLVLVDAIGAVALGIDDNAELVVDQIVGVIGEDRAYLAVRDPGRLGIGQRDRHPWLALPAGGAGLGALPIQGAQRAT